MCPHVFPGDFFSQKTSSLVIPCSIAPGICNKSNPWAELPDQLSTILKNTKHNLLFKTCYTLRFVCVPWCHANTPFFTPLQWFWLTCCYRVCVSHLIVYLVIAPALPSTFRWWYSHVWGIWAVPRWRSQCSWQSGRSVWERGETRNNSFCSYPSQNKEMSNESKWSLQYSALRWWWKNHWNKPQQSQ